jgi:AraC family transcriptional regulator of adaptative response / DNA-3-methyladenine glycosylase II
MSSDDVMYQAMLARDYRFDGKFFVAVKTTGVYCRPICPAKPKRENCIFFPHALAAERAGYRPCLRCRPEAAPLSPAWFGNSAVVQRALRVIAANGLIAGDEDAFAAQFGVTGRHLRRLFEHEVGQTPKQISDSNRLNFARKLVVETAMPITTLAMTAGFASLRRFNDAFKARFARTPSQLRRGHAQQSADRGVELSLSYRPPYDWETIHRYNTSHRVPGIESFGPNWYQRVFSLAGSVGVLRVWPDSLRPQLKAEIHTDNPAVLFEVASRIRRMFDLDSDPILIANSFAESHFLGRLYNKYPGLRLPRGWDGFETAIRTVLGQLVSIERASQLVGQVIAQYGQEVSHPITKQPLRLFPTPQVLARADLAEVGTTTARKQTIRQLSQRVLDRTLSFSEAQDPDQFRQTLLSIDGIGQWSAQYISLRTIGDTDAFPATDLILQRALQRHPDLSPESFKPWRSYVAVYLWKEYAQQLSKRKEKKHELVLQ